jgi:hypothetical protein
VEEKKNEKTAGDPYRTPSEPGARAPDTDHLQAAIGHMEVSDLNFDQSRCRLLRAQNHILLDIAENLRKLVAIPERFEAWAKPAIKDLISVYERQQSVEPVSIGLPCVGCGKVMFKGLDGKYVCKECKDS